MPFFHKGSLKAWKAATFNAKAETARTLVSFRETFKRRRCLIAADGWVEWKGEGTPKPKFTLEPVMMSRYVLHDYGVGRAATKTGRSKASRW